ncbi:MAG: dienelactone hydrolase family protein [Patescibacteria group bacterium]
MKRSHIFAILIFFILLGALFFLKYPDQQDPTTVPVVQKPNETIEEPESTTSPERNVDILRRAPRFEVTSKNVSYFNGSTGYFVSPTEPGDFPGIVMIHEWWGLNDHIKDMAEQLAGQGYKVFAVDLFGTVATTPEEALAQTTALNQDIALQNLQAAKDYLQNEGASKIASLGWCFGGGQSLQLSLATNLDATVIYYGNLVTESSELANLNSPVLGIFGAEDTTISIDDVEKFAKELESLEIEGSINIYPNVGHAFANPTGNNYSQEETLDAWNKTLSFLEENLK